MGWCAALRGMTGRMTLRRVLHALWILVASVVACVGIGWALLQHPDAHSAVRPVAFLRYLGVIVALAVASYALHRRGFKTSPLISRERATRDTVLSAVGGGPVLFFLFLVVTTYLECHSDTSC